MVGTLRALVLSWPALVVLAALVVVVALVPRLRGGGSEGLTAADRAFSAVCRAHGGTPKLAPGSGDYVKDARFCEARFGGDTYEMYAVHASGWSASEAARARRSCLKQAADARRDANADGRFARRYVWHERAGVCEDAQA